MHSVPARDIQVVLRDATDPNLALYTVSVTPLVMWVWWGSVLVAGAGLMVAFDAAMGRARRARALARAQPSDSQGGAGEQVRP